MQKIGTVTVSVYKTEHDNTHFEIQSNNDDVLPVQYVIEDTLKLY